MAIRLSSICVAAIGVCILCVSASVGTLFIFRGKNMLVAIPDSIKPYDSEALSLYTEKLLLSDKNTRFIMTCFNRDAIDVMCRLKNIYPNIKFSVINILKERKPELDYHYIQIFGYDKVPKETAILNLNDTICKESDIIIRNTNGTISLFFK